MRTVNSGSSVSALAWTGQTFFTGGQNGQIQQWGLDSDEATLDIQGHRVQVNSLDYEPSSALLASGSSDQTVIVQKVNFTSTPAPLHTLTGHISDVYEVKFSPSDPHILATCDIGGEVRLWDAHSGNCIHIFQNGFCGALYLSRENYINFSPDGKLLACCGNEVKVFRVASGQVII